MHRFLFGGGLFWAALASSSTFAAAPADFHRAVYALHEQQITQHPIRTEEERGDYEGSAAARYSYIDTRYYDSTSGHLLSRVRRDAASPEQIHIVEVNVYEQGRLVRDFGSVTMPWAPTIPVRTMINLHHYNGELHSFRQHDYYGDVVYESCDGKLMGKRVRLSLDASDIEAASKSAPAYQPCFSGIEKKWAQYLNPH